MPERVLLRKGGRLGAAFVLSILPSLAAAAQEPETSAVRALQTRGMKADVAALIMSGQEGGTLPLDVLALPLADDGDKARVPLLLEIDGRALASDDARRQRLEIFAYALARDGGLKDVLMQAFEVDRDRLPPGRAEQGLKFFGAMELAPGSYTLRVLARDAGSSSVGIRSLPVTVPGPEAGPSLSPPILADSRDTRLLLRAPGESAAAAESALKPVLPGTDLPAARPIIRPGEERTFRLVAHHLDEASSQLVAELTDAQGRKVAELPSRVQSYSAPAASGGFRVLTASFEPGRLEPGEYRLRVVAEGPGDARVESAALPVVVAGARRDAGTEMAAAPPIEKIVRKPRKSRLRKRQEAALAKSLSAAYGKALEMLASGQPEAALEAVLKLEQDAIASKRIEALDVLRRVENDTFRRIASKDPESLEPVMLLQFRLYCEARRQVDTLLSTHARNMMLRFVELYLDENQSPEAEIRAARFLVSLAGELQKGSMVRLSEGLFLRVLELDETNEAALLGLAARHEKIGDYRAAIRYAKTLVDAYPDHGHGRLRLAINLARDGKGRAARRHLQQIIETNHDRWILSLAYQELARFYLEKNLLDEAEKILREGLERLPGEEKLYVALAFVFDARQQPARAQEVLAELARQPARDEGSARHRYTRYPSEALAKTRRLLDLDAQARLPDLLAVLASANRLEGLL